jgi:hypothetical protein
MDKQQDTPLDVPQGYVWFANLPGAVIPTETGCALFACEQLHVPPEHVVVERQGETWVVFVPVAYTDRVRARGSSRMGAIQRLE